MVQFLPVYCIGDSHSCIFSGEAVPWFPPYPAECAELLPWAKARHWGTRIAYNLTLEKIQHILVNIPIGSHIMFVLGEIDCYYHLYPQARKQSRSLDDVTKECVGRYVDAIQKVREHGYMVSIRDVIPSEPWEGSNSGGYGLYTALFSDTVRDLKENDTNRLFNFYTKQLCDEFSIPFIQVFDAFVGPDGLANLEYYLPDRHHLNMKGLPILKDAIFTTLNLQGEL